MKVWPLTSSLQMQESVVTNPMSASRMPSGSLRPFLQHGAQPSAVKDVTEFARICLFQDRLTNRKQHYRADVRAAQSQMICERIAMIE